MDKKLCRIRKNQFLGGVCTGLADYFKIDVVIMRVIMISLVFINFTGVLLYILLWIMVPYQSEENIAKIDQPAAGADSDPASGAKTLLDNLPEQIKNQAHNRSFLGGLILVALGVAFLLDEWIDFLDSSFFWPALLILIGAALIINSKLSAGKDKDGEIKS